MNRKLKHIMVFSAHFVFFLERPANSREKTRKVQ